ncbi:MAG: acyl-CoA thioesterase [Gemmatimonadetes bacterium]|nr:acyl-CoA thioesterase [Gemmatimonadota bacterium]
MNASARAALPWHFETEADIRFGYCDPAGIAYFPRLDELFNGLFEDWCTAVGIPLNTLILRDKIGFPLVHATVEYEAPLRLGDRVRLVQQVHAIGTSSLTVDVRIERGTVRCVSGRHVRVMMSLESASAMPILPAVRAQFATDPPNAP